MGVDKHHQFWNSDHHINIRLTKYDAFHRQCNQGVGGVSGGSYPHKYKASGSPTVMTVTRQALFIRYHILK